MNDYWWFVVILVTANLLIFGAGWLTSRKPRIPLERLADPAPLPGELPTAGYFDLPGTLARFAAPDGPYGPFPADTGPLLILSESDAANEELELYTQDLIAEAEAKIPPRWR